MADAAWSPDDSSFRSLAGVKNHGCRYERHYAPDRRFVPSTWGQACLFAEYIAAKVAIFSAFDHAEREILECRLTPRRGSWCSPMTVPTSMAGRCNPDR